ncbi:arsenate reductase [Ligilactobacillus hayakitensis DSM 18933 = JCM 14209]|uniref:Arsenate reductase n=2 Tax=Ligilactobacillus TaxID=2767887 RepID=A0A0R1WHS9_9LACO|nr:arsenate reductase [Ligilactobacillus hayakitensis DSM 18933 = JCM 14209]
MAEGYAKKFLDTSLYEVQSAGVETHGLNPNAVKVMNEDNIDISNQQSKLIDPNYLNSADLVITLCGDAKDRCPVTPSTVKKLHVPFTDPAQATGTKEEQLAVFRQVRDEIRNFIQTIPNLEI